MNARALIAKKRLLKFAKAARRGRPRHLDMTVAVKGGETLLLADLEALLEVPAKGEALKAHPSVERTVRRYLKRVVGVVSTHDGLWEEVALSLGLASPASIPSSVYELVNTLTVRALKRVSRRLDTD